MKYDKTVRFIGLYASFPLKDSERHSGVLEAFLGLEPSSFKRMKYGQTMGKTSRVYFTAQRLERALKSIKTGDVDFLQLIPYRENESWAEFYKKSITVSWGSSLLVPTHRPLSPVEERFGYAGTIQVTYPISWFAVDSVSPFQGKLIGFMKELFVKEEVSWSFVHQGYRPVRPYSVGTDDIFLETRKNFPLTSFDYDLLSGARYYREFAKGAFWANFLNPLHVKALGGIQRIHEENPCSVVEELGSGRVLLQVGPSPLTADESRATNEYQRLRKFLKPILLETHDEQALLHKEVTGSWKSPEVSETEWKNILASHKRKPATSIRPDPRSVMHPS